MPLCHGHPTRDKPFALTPAPKEPHLVYELRGICRHSLLEAPIPMAEVDGGTEVAVQLSVSLGLQHVVLLLVLEYKNLGGDLIISASVTPSPN